MLAAGAVSAGSQPILMNGKELEYGAALIPHRWYRSIYGRKATHTVEHVGDEDFICGKPAWVGGWHDSDAGVGWYNLLGRFFLEEDGRGRKCVTCRSLLKQRQVDVPFAKLAVGEEQLRPLWQRDRRGDLVSWGCAEMCLLRGGLL